MKPRYLISNREGQPIKADEDGLPEGREPGRYCRTDRITGESHLVVIKNASEYRIQLLDKLR